MIRVVLPSPLQRLAKVGAEVQLEVDGPVTQRSVLDALEAGYPALRGVIRDHATHERRAFIRFFVAGQDLSLAPCDAPLPQAVTDGLERFRIVAAMAGG